MRLVALGVALAFTGCFGPSETTCGDGTICPDGKVCAPTGGACVDPDQLAACADLGDGDRCDLAAVGHGVCRNGVCLVEGCGDGVVAADEVCDDGNTTSGDGCRADCQKLEECGDGVVDPQEACDDGNTNPADGCDACKLTAWSATVIVGGSSISPTQMQLAYPRKIALDPLGNLFVADAGNHRILRIDAASHAITLIAGNGTAGTGGDGGPAVTAELQNPEALAVDGAGNVFIGDSNKIRRVDALTGLITTLAGKVLPEGIGPRTIARMLDPGQLVVAPTFTLVSGGREGIVQAVRPTVVDMVIGRYLQQRSTGNLARYRNVDYGPIGGLAMDGNTVYVATKNHVDAVTIVDPANADTWTMTLLAGDSNDAAGFADGATALFRGVGGLWVDTATNTLYVADTGNHVVRAIDLTTKITSTVAGKPHTLGYFGENVDPRQALLFRPRAVVMCGGENVDPQQALLYRPRAIAMCGSQLFIADTNNHRVRRVAGGKIRTVLGTGVPSSSGDGAPAINFPVEAPAGLACDSSGNVYVTSSMTVRLLASDSASLGRRVGAGQHDLRCAAADNVSHVGHALSERHRGYGSDDGPLCGRLYRPADRSRSAVTATSDRLFMIFLPSHSSRLCCFSPSRAALLCDQRATCGLDRYSSHPLASRRAAGENGSMRNRCK